MTIMLIAAILVACGYALAYGRAVADVEDLATENAELRWKLANHTHPALRRTPWEN